MTYEDGTKYEGSWKNGKKHGRGTFTDRSGKSKVRTWKNGFKVEKSAIYETELPKIVHPETLKKPKV